MVWPVFDEQLFSMKLAELAPELRKKTGAATRRARFERRRLGQGMTVGSYAAIADAQIEVLREHLKEVDRICREVWRAQGGTETPQFVRAVIRDKVFQAIAARFGSIKWGIEREASRFTRRMSVKDKAESLLLSPKTLRSFNVAAYITLVSIGAVLIATLFARTLPDDHSIPISKPIFLVIYVVVAIMLAAGLYLWIGMLYFLLKIDRRTPLSKIAWLVVLLIFNSWAATVYFFAVYRGQVPRTAHATHASA
jgi:hypothetical protein